MAPSASASRARPHHRRPASASSSSSPLATTAALASGLLASSCCVLQLALNAASIGCAGFSVLTPWRPVFRGLTAASLAALVARQGLTDRRTLATAAAALALAASSDVLAAVNRRGGIGGGEVVSLSSSSSLPPILLLPPLVAAPLRRALAPLLLSLPDSHALRVYLDAASAQGGGGTESAATAARNVTLRVRGVRCEACAARVRGALQGVPGVTGAAVEGVESGEAAVVVSVVSKGEDEEGADHRGRLVAALEALNAGYEVVVEEE